MNTQISNREHLRVLCERGLSLFLKNTTREMQYFFHVNYDCFGFFQVTICNPRTWGNCTEAKRFPPCDWRYLRDSVRLEDTQAELYQRLFLSWLALEQVHAFVQTLSCECLKWCGCLFFTKVESKHCKLKRRFVWCLCPIEASQKQSVGFVYFRQCKKKELRSSLGPVKRKYFLPQQRRNL